MKKLLYTLFLLTLGLVSPALVVAQTITGTVFQDINFNGTKDAVEPGVGSVIVRAYDDNDPIATPTATAVSSATGVYTLTGLAAATKYRLEISNPNSWLFPGPNGTGSQTTVRIATTGATNVNFGLVLPTDYCQTVPDVIVPCFVSGNPLGNGTAGSEDALVKFNYNNSGTSGSMVHLASAKKIGTVWGVAYQRETKKLFSSAFLKRHSGIGPGGLGAIYISDVNTFEATSVYADLTTLGVTLAAPADLTYINSTRNGTLPAVATSSSQDSQVFPLIGKVGMGGMDLSTNGDTLWIVNLYEKKLIRILLGNPHKVSLTSGDITQYTIPDPGCASGSWRPWAVRYEKGKVYVGGVCDAGTAGARSNLRAYVYTFNPAAGTFNGTPVIQYPLDYTKGATHTGDAAIGKNWEPWRDTWADMFKGGVLSAGTRTARPQPILSDIDFDESGNMLMTFTDRGGHQLGVGQQAIPDDGKRYNGYINGDLLISKNNGNGTFTLESNGSITGKTGSGVGNGQGPGGGEFFANDLYPASGSTIHQETVMGATLILPGKNEAMVISMDPLNVWTGGVNVSNLTTGASIRRYQIYATGPGANGSQGKSNGLGLTAPGCDPAPIEIGNVIWLDSDSDGIQDPGEAGIAGVIVELRKADNTPIASAVTDGSGFYLFSNAAGTSTGSAKYGLTGLTYFTGYKVSIPNVTGGSKQSALGINVLTQNDNGGADALADLRDSDGTLSGNNAQTATFITGSGAKNDHTFDFGFKPFVAPQPPAPCTLISGLSSNLVTVCNDARTIDFTITHDNNLTPAQTMKLVYSTTALTAAQLYSGSGTTLTAAIAPVTGQTSKLVTATMPANGGASPMSYFVYVVFETAPTDPDCRPFGAVSPITVNPQVAPATFPTGTYFEICDRDDATTGAIVENVKNLNSIVSGNTTGVWSVNGSPAMSGTFTGGIYTAAQGDAGKTFTFTYTLTGTGPAGSDCATKTYTVTIKVNACPCYQTQTICGTETVRAEVPAGYTVTWYKENGTTDTQIGNPGDDFIIINATGEYYYTGTDANGCAVELCCHILVTQNTLPAVINTTQQTICNVNRPSTAATDNAIDLDNQFVSGNNTGTWALAPSSPTAIGTLGAGNVFTANGADAGKTLIFRYTIIGSAGCPDLTYDVPVLVNSCDCPTFTSILTPGTVCSDENYSLTLHHTDAPSGGNVQFYYNTNSSLDATDLYATNHGLSTLIGTVPIGTNGSTSINNVQLPSSGTSITYYIYAIYVPSPAIANCQPFVIGTPASVTVQGPTVPATVTIPASPICNVNSGNNDNVFNLMTLVTGNTNGTWSSSNPTAQAAISGNVFTATAGMAGQTFTLTYTVHGASGSQTSACGDIVYTIDITIKDCSCPSVDILTTSGTPSTVCSNQTFSVTINHRANPGNLRLYYIEDTGNDGTELTASQLYSGGNGGATALGAVISPTVNSITTTVSGLSLPVNTSGTTKNYIIYVGLALGNVNIGANCQPISQKLITALPETPTATLTPTATVCESGYSTGRNIIDLNTLITAGFTGGTWIDTDNSGGLSGSVFTAAPSMVSSTFTFTYKIAGIGSGNCGDRLYTVSVTVNNCAIPNCGTITSIAPATEAICSDSPFSVIIQHTAGIGSMSLYWGETTAYNNYDFYTDGFDNSDVHFLGNITPASGAATTTTATGLTLPVYNGAIPRDVYLYVVLKSDNGNRVIPFCIPYAYNTMQQDPAFQANAGTDGSTEICLGSVTVVDLFSLITGEQTGGTWTRLTGTGGTFDAGAGTFTPAVGSTTSTFQYTITGQLSCPGDVSVATVIVSLKQNAGPDQIICAGQTATLTGTNPTTGTWNAQANPANPVGATLSTTTAGIATVSFASTASGIFKFVYTANGCSDTVQVTVTPKPSAGVDQTVCAGTVATLTGTGPATGTWSAQTSPANPPGATLSTTNAGVATVSFVSTASGIFKFVYAANGCSDTVQVTVKAKPDAGADQIICAGQTATLTGTNPATGTWSAQVSPANPAGAVLGTTAAGVATVSFPSIVSGIFKFVYTVNGCSDTVQVIVNTKPNAGNDQTGVCAGQTVTLTGTGTSITGIWSAQTSPANPAGAILGVTTGGVATVSFATTASGVFRFVYRANGCSDTVQVTVSPKPSAGQNQTVCAGTNATLTGTNPTTGTWIAQASPVNPPGAILGTTTAGVATVSFASTASGVFNFVYIANSCTDTVQITVNSKPNAGADLVSTGAICNTIATVDLPNAANGESWTQLGGAPKVVTINAATGVVTGMDAIGTYQFVLRNPTTGCADTVAVETKNCLKGSLGDFVWKDINDNGIQDLPSEKGVKGVIVQLLNSTGTIVLATDTTDANGIYGFTGLDTDNYRVKIVLSSLPDTCQISPKQDVSTGGGNDTNDSDFDPITGLSPIIEISTLDTGIQKDNPTIDAALYTPCVKPSAGQDVIICQGTTTVNLKDATVNEAWSKGPQPAGTNAVITPSTGIVTGLSSAGDYYFILTYKGQANCSDTVKVTVNSKPNAGADLVSTGAICNTVATVDLPNAANGESWTQLGGAPKVVTINAATGVVTGMDAIGTYQFILRNPTTGCADTVAVETKNCLKGSLGDFVWKDINDNGIQDLPSEKGVKDVIVQLLNGNTNAVLATDTTDTNGIYGFTGLDTGNYKVKIVLSSLPDTCQISPKQDVTTGGGNDTNDSDFNPTTGESPIIEISTLGTGIQKDNPTIDAALYTPCVKPVWQITSAPVCSPVTAVYSVSFTITNKKGNLKVNTGTLSGSNPYTVSNIPNGTNLIITDSLRANCKYDTTIVAPDCSCPQITLLTPNATACKGDTLPTLKIFLAGSNTNGVGANWYSASMGGLLLGSGLTFKPSGNLSATTTFYIELTGTSGNCINQPRTPVTVTAQDCNVDLALKKSISTKIAQIGDVLTYTLKVWNESGSNASGVEVADSISMTAQFQTGSFVASRGSASINSSVIKWNIGSIAANGDTVTLTYQVKAIQQGLHFNTAEISKVNEKDVDSTPGNGTEGEDDIDRQCFSVPIKICAAEKIEASVPARYLNVQWFKNGGTTAIASGNTVLLTGEGIYTFTATNNSCPAGGCCPIIIEAAANCCPEDICVPFTIKQTKKAGKPI